MNFIKHEFIRLVECHANLTLNKRSLRCVIYELSNLFISVELVLRKLRQNYEVVQITLVSYCA